MTPLEQALITFAIFPATIALHVLDTSLARRRTRRLNVAADRAARSVRS